MRYFLLVVLAFVFGQARSQSNCRKNSPLFQFDIHEHPRLFTDKLGNHPQFPFLQREKGVTTPNLVIHFVKDPESQKKAQEGRDLRNEGRVEDGKEPKTTKPGTGH